VSRSLHLVQAEMDRLPFRTAEFDLVIAHGVWNLATSDEMFRQSVREAARVMRRGAALFVFTFSRNTLAADAEPLDRQRYTFDQFSGRPQIFLTADELLAELTAAGFATDASVPLTEHNRRSRTLLASGPPVIYEGAFRRMA
jgi:SAM-dependent methyltransferase